MSLPAVLFVLLQTDAAADGGIASISQIVAGLQRHRPIIVTDRDGTRTDEWRSRGFEVHVVPQTASLGLRRNPLGSILSYWRYARALGRLIGHSGARVIHANDPLGLQLALVPARIAGASLLFNVRGTFDPVHPPSRAKYRLLFAMADHVLFLSHDMARRWTQIAPNATSSYDVTYSAVDSEIFSQSPGTENEPIVLVSGLIRHLKGQLEFIEHVAPSLAREGVRMFLAGDFHPETNQYMAACAKAAIPFGDAIRFLGYRTDIPQLTARSSVVAVTSRHEGLVRAMLEGMSCARPVVSFDICSAREILESQSGGAGVVVENGNYREMAAAILRYCRDSNLSSKAGERGRATALRLFSAAKVIARYERAYRMLEERKPAVRH